MSSQSRTERFLDSGGFDIEPPHDGLADDIRAANALDPQDWPDMKATLRRAALGTCRRKIPGSDVDRDGDWDAPMSGSGMDIGELRRPINSAGRLYRLYVSAHPSRFALWILHLNWKPSSSDPRSSGIQDGHVATAEERLGDLYQDRL